MEKASLHRFVYPSKSVPHHPPISFTYSNQQMRKPSCLITYFKPQIKHRLMILQPKIQPQKPKKISPRIFKSSHEPRKRKKIFSYDRQSSLKQTTYSLHNDHTQYDDQTNPLSRKLARSKKQTKTLEKRKRIFKQQPKYSDMLRIYNSSDTVKDYQVQKYLEEPQSLSQEKIEKIQSNKSKPQLSTDKLSINKVVDYENDEDRFYDYDLKLSRKHVSVKTVDESFLRPFHRVKQETKPLKKDNFFQLKKFMKSIDQGTTIAIFLIVLGIILVIFQTFK